jgi:Outer membrane protein beta-barrel domain
MKKAILGLFFIACFTGIATAQKFRINAYGSYVFDDAVDSYNSSTAYFNGTVKGGFQWGAGLEYMFNHSSGFEFNYLHQSTNAPFTYYIDGVKDKTFDMGINYYLFDFNHYFELSNEKIEPFFGAGLGWAGLSASSEGHSGNRSAFAWNVKGGTNIWLGKNVALKLQAQLVSGSAATGGGYFWSYWGPIYATTYTSIYQFGLGGGLVFKLGK